uniref:C3H1-type domain-containing protein n=1 Tax=Chromera velia CCMP2878 TaxID=1169474 RepID=A0A0G4GT08_9ALVE|eukprot:Cvel_23271.t1-p1 / transcript=Cvel_23271.t1 / gene=Cvel_23271 / organism=Chromera_velia_CCMP2878 / gene_product=hypothetical protein / transcript_product=hypothetical protein / location=Cvel_scaffold2379:19644-23067(-) / protein_length=474 / sequence_SO=supercontig / SO=protein_coding / is_pseudo=false
MYAEKSFLVQSERDLSCSSSSSSSSSFSSSSSSSSSSSFSSSSSSSFSSFFSSSSSSSAAAAAAACTCFLSSSFSFRPPAVRPNEACRFAHGVDDLRWGFACSRGNDCTYAHSFEELNSARQLAAGPTKERGRVGGGPGADTAGRSLPPPPEAFSENFRRNVQTRGMGCRDGWYDNRAPPPARGPCQWGAFSEKGGAGGGRERGGGGGRGAALPKAESTVSSKDRYEVDRRGMGIGMGTPQGRMYRGSALDREPRGGPEHYPSYPTEQWSRRYGQLEDHPDLCGRRGRDRVDGRDRDGGREGNRHSMFPQEFDCWGGDRDREEGWSPRRGAWMDRQSGVNCLPPFAGHYDQLFSSSGRGGERPEGDFTRRGGGGGGYPPDHERGGRYGGRGFGCYGSAAEDEFVPPRGSEKRPWGEEFNARTASSFEWARRRAARGAEGGGPMDEAPPAYEETRGGNGKGAGGVNGEAEEPPPY